MEIKQRKCKCGRTIPVKFNSTIQAKKCPHCTYLDATSGKVKKQAKKSNYERKKAVHWKDKPTNDMIKYIQKEIVNPYIRERDNTCFAGKSISDNGAISDAGHYYSVGSKAGMRFNPQNIHGQSASGNRFKGSDALNYRAGLVERHGENYVKELELQAKISEGVKSLDRYNVIMIAETYLYLHKNKIWVFALNEFDDYKIKLHEQRKTTNSD